MTHKREQKRLGRFIKNSDSRLLENISLFKFSFEEICESPITTRDNPSSNIIRHRLHLKEEIDDVVLDPEGMNKDLRDEDSKLPIIMPVDFTSEWKRLRSKSNNKSVRLEEDEDLDLDENGDLIAKKNSDDQTKSSARGLKPIHHNPEIVSEEKILSAPIAQVDMGQIPSTEEIERLSFEAQKNSIDTVGKAILDINNPNSTQSTHEPSDHQHQEDFKTTITNEKELVDEYIKEQRSQASKFSEEAAEKILEEYKQRGFEEGFKVGEEKAILQVTHEMLPVYENLQSIVNELGNLKKNILNQAQNNFYEISQAVAEALLRREFTINPESFSKLIQQAISDAVTDDKITIYVNPTTLEHMKNIKDDGIVKNMHKDDRIPIGDFKIETSKGIVDGNIQKLVKQLLDQADSELFDKQSDDHKKAS